MITGVNECIILDYSAVDNDTSSTGRKDSLVYRIIPPRESATTKVSYVSPYTYLKPFKYAGFPKGPRLPFTPPSCQGFDIDSITGELRTQATKAEVTVFAYKVEDYSWDASGKPYRRGEIMRDLTLITINMKSNKVPSVSGFNGTTSTDTTWCSGVNHCITINSYDPDTKDTVIVDTGSFALYPMKITVDTGKLHPRITVCWNPPASAIRSTPYTFLISAHDNACPLPARTAKLFSIRVAPNMDSFVTKTSANSCGIANFSVSPAIAGKTLSNVIWTIDSGTTLTGNSVSHHFLKPGKYKWSVSVGGTACARMDSGIINIDTALNVSLSAPAYVCGTDMSNQTLSIKKISASGTLYYNWKGGAGSASISIPVRHDTTIYYSVIDSISSGKGISCHYSDSVHIIKRDLLYDSVRHTVNGCQGLSYQVKYHGARPSVFTWSGDDGLAGTGDTIFHKYSGSGSYKWKFSTNDSLCAQSDSGLVKIESAGSVLIGGDTSVCYDDTSRTLQLKAVLSRTSSRIRYLWYNSSTGSSTSYKLNYFIPTNPVSLTIYDSASGCTAFASRKISVDTILKPAIAVKSNIIGTSLSATKYQWYLNTSPITGADSATHYITASGVYRLRATSARGYTAYSDTLTVLLTGIGSDQPYGITEMRIYPNPVGDILHIS